MGAMGSDAAIEAADVVLMDDDPLQIANAILLSRKCLRIVYENIVFALGIKFLCLGLGAVGIANMWFAIFADVGVMILAILNAIRALYAPSVSIKRIAGKWFCNHKVNKIMYNRLYNMFSRRSYDGKGKRIGGTVPAGRE